MRPLLIATMLALASPLGSQPLRDPRFENVSTVDEVTDAINATPDTAVAAFCVTKLVRRSDNTGYVVMAMTPAPTIVNPLCPGPNAVVLLVRPTCIFTIPEFLELRMRAAYVVLVCRPDGVGLPLERVVPPARAAPDGTITRRT